MNIGQQKINSNHFFFKLTIIFGLIMVGFYIFFLSVILRYGIYEKDFGWKISPKANYYVISEITKESNAFEKLQIGDKILAINGDTSIQKNPAVLDSFSKIAKKIQVGEIYSIKVFRDSQEYNFNFICKLTYNYERLTVLATFFLSSLVFFVSGFLIGLLKPEEKAPRQMSLALLTTSVFMLMISTKTMSSFLQGFDHVVYQILWFSYPTIFPLAYSAALEFPPNITKNKLLQFFKYPLFLLTALIFLGLQISLLRVYDLNFYFPVIEDLFVDIYFLEYFDFFWDLLIQTSLLMTMVATLHNYLCVKDIDQRRRVKWVVYSAIFGLLPSLLNNVLSIFWDSDSHKYETANHFRFFIARFAEFSVTALPISLVYVITKHQIFDINFIIRRGLQYLLAKNVIRFVLVLEALGILAIIIFNPSLTVGEIFSIRSPYLYLIGSTSISVIYRTQIMSSLDRIFFRKAYNIEKILADLIEQIKLLDSINEISKLVITKLKETLHPKNLYFFYRSGEDNCLTLEQSFCDITKLRSISESSELVELMQKNPITKNRSLINLLSKEENLWLDNLQVQIIVPMLGQNKKLVGLFLLGEKLSDEPYSKNDYKFLEAIASHLAIVYENNLLKQKVEKENKIKQNVISKLEKQNFILVKECPKCHFCFDSTDEFCTNDKTPLELSLPVERVVEGKYRLEKMIGKGGMGAVYSATDLRLDRKIALKILHGAMFGDQEAIRRFEREAKTSAKLTHPNIVTIYDYGKLQTEGTYLVMELVKGITLKDKINNKGTIPPKEVAELFDQILDGIKTAHSAGIIHRDLKPGNIIICEENGKNIIKILDFGIAKIKHIDVNDPKSLTAPGTIVGTFGYMPPEQFSAEEVDERNDIFSLGVMVIEALTGSKPFVGKTIYELMGSMLKQTFTLPGDSQEIKELNKVLQKCISKDPKQRFRYVQEMQAELIPAISKCNESDFVRSSENLALEDQTTKNIHNKTK